MQRLGKRDVKEILKILEEEVDKIPRMEKVQKMKMRGKIRQQENWLVALGDPKPNKIILKLKGRLTEVWNRFPYGFADKLTEAIQEMIKKLDTEK